eukprot:2692876-Amphidinium_carterae.1
MGSRAGRFTIRTAGLGSRAGRIPTPPLAPSGQLAGQEEVPQHEPPQTFQGCVLDSGKGLAGA